MRGPRGSLLLLLVLFALLLVRSRAALSPEGLPAFFVEKAGDIPVHLGGRFPDPGVHQFSDDPLPKDVIAMTAPPGGVQLGPEDLPEVPLRPGEALELSLDPGQSAGLTRRWMPAGQRVALGIPLHPDRMTVEDWEYLPGIGPRLAQAIELDRQQNGDFGSLEALERVKGIGPKRIEKWREYFAEN